MTAAVDSAKAPDHRRLRFQTLDDMRAEIDRIVAAEQAGSLRRSGHWTAGQIFGHLATWISYGYEGYPMRVPWFIRFILRFKVKSYLRDGMPTGVRIPNVEGGTYGTEPLSTEEGVRRLRAALQRLDREPARYDSPAFGQMTEEQRVALNLRHAELHLGFLHPA
jgi:hypothetical protein